jgi:hypothetical protein
MHRTVTIVERYHGKGNKDYLIHGSSFQALFMDFFLLKGKRFSARPVV